MTSNQAERLEKLLDAALAALKNEDDPEGRFTIAILAEALKAAEALPQAPPDIKPRSRGYRSVSW